MERITQTQGDYLMTDKEHFEEINDRLDIITDSLNSLGAAHNELKRIVSTLG